MSEQPQTPPIEPAPSPVTNASGRVTVQPGDDANIGGDVVGRDKVTTTTTVTNVGMTPEAVRRLVLSVGALVFVTAFCFFSGGIVVGFAALQAFNRPLPSTEAAAQDFQSGLNQVQALPPGQAFQWAYTETDLSSYMRLILGPQIGFDARARFLSTDEVAFQGNWAGLGGRPVTVVTRMETNSPQVYHTVSAAVQLIPIDNSSFGWIPLPVAVVQPLVDAINRDIGRGYTAKAIDFPEFRPVAGSDTPVPLLNAPLQIIGVSE